MLNSVPSCQLSREKPLLVWWCSDKAVPRDVLKACGAEMVDADSLPVSGAVDVLVADDSVSAEASLATVRNAPQAASVMLLALGEATVARAASRLSWPPDQQSWQAVFQLVHQLRFTQDAASDLRQEVTLAENRLAVAEGQLADVQERMVELEHQASVAQLVRSLAHELNNPLAVMLGNSELIARDAAQSPQLLRRAGCIVEQVDECKSIINRLRKFARPQGEAAEGLSLAQVIAQAIQRLQRRGHVVPNVQVADHLPLLRCGRQALLRSVEQVLDNALRAGASSITVFPENTGSACTIAFANDGVTPSEEALRQACRPFYSERGGAGLGMSLAATLLADYQGKIALHTGRDGTGAQVLITLPEWTTRDDSARTPSNARHQALQRTHQRNVLVVEDEDLLAELIVLTAEELGWGVRVARSVSELAEAHAQWRADAVIADVHIVGGDGLAIVAEMLRQQPRLGVVVMSGDVQQAKVQDFVAAHGCQVLAKPFRIQDLRVLLEDLACKKA
ncbi:MAG: hybrid sensor histidine kinase/response regulator [Planctomycetota bacterium]|nr:MAG: hybrid sensor histidine kinase/response regulator [Planctomycetota bacterium]